MAHSTRTLLLDGDWDITLTEAGNLALAEGYYATAQNVANECRLFTQDAFFAQDDGIPWYVAQLGKPLARSVASSRMRQAASDVSGVVSVESVTVEDIGPVTRIMDGTIRLTTTEGTSVAVDL